MRSVATLAGPINSWGNLVSSVTPGLERIFSRSLNTSVTTTTPSFLASSTVRGSRRWHNILKLDSSHSLTVYFVASAYLSTGSISGRHASIPLIATGLIKSSWYFVEMERRFIQCWSEGSLRPKQRLKNSSVPNYHESSGLRLTRVGESRSKSEIRPPLDQARELRLHSSIRPLSFRRKART